MELVRKIHFTVLMSDNHLMKHTALGKFDFIKKIAELRKLHGKTFTVIKNSIKVSDTVELGKVTKIIKAS